MLYVVDINECCGIVRIISEFEIIVSDSIIGINILSYYIFHIFYITIRQAIRILFFPPHSPETVSLEI